jgi:anaphase-promoting complex subunit 8
MWCALGQCYQDEQLQPRMYEAALRCYQRALRNNDREGIALAKLVRCSCLWRCS